jgi:hypothetical protein
MDNVTKLPTENGEPATKKRSQSTIKFPYADLGDAEQLTREVFNNGGECKPEQLAAWLGHDTMNSGAFRNKVSAARIFGLIESTRNSINVTQSGKRIAAEHTAAKERVAAFLAVPLYAALYEEHKNGQLPPDNGLEQAMIRLGVTPTQAQNARQVFQRSADHAGFFAVSRARLVLPAGGRAASTTDTGKGQDKTGGGGGAGDGTPPKPPAGTFPKVIEGILEEAPWGKEWDEEQFHDWADLFTRAARVHFKLPRKREGDA